jgi:hypothetical protein
MPATLHQRNRRDPTKSWREVTSGRVTSERVGRETVDYVGNIYKYYVAYKLVMATKQAQDQARKSIRRKKSP